MVKKTSRYKWLVLTAVACGTFMATLDSSIVNIALPTITNYWNTDISRVKWVMIIYLLVITAFLLPFGKIADLFGRKRIFGFGFLIFTLASLFCGVAPNLLFLVFARAIQGLGAAMLMANGPAIITAAFPASERGRALGILAMIVSAGLISGPGLGGFLISEWGWRGIFIINIPIGLLGALLVYLFIPKDQTRTRPPSFDWMGALLQSIVLLSFIIVFDPPRLSMSGSVPIEVPRIWLTVFAFLMLALFLKVETLVDHPIIDLSVIRIRSYWMANLAGFLMFVAYSAVSVLMPFFLEEVQALSTTQMGLYLSVIPLTMLVVSPISGRLSDRFGSRELCSFGTFLIALVLLCASGTLPPGLHPNTSPTFIVIGLALVGVGVGLFQSPNNNLLMSEIPEDKLSIGSAFLATVRNLGLTVGAGFAVSFFEFKLDSTNNYSMSVRITFLVAAVIAVLAMMVSAANLGSEGKQWPGNRKRRR